MKICEFPCRLYRAWKCFFFSDVWFNLEFQSFTLIIYIIKLLRGILHLLLDFSSLISALFPLFPYKGTNHADFRSFLSSLRNFYFIFIILFFNGVTIERSIGRKKKEKCFYLILILKFVSNYPSYDFFFMILFRRNVTIKSWVIFKYRKKKFTFFSPLKWLKNPVHNFFFFFTRFRWPTFQKSNSPDKKLANSFDGGFKNQRIRKKICQKVPSLIHIHFPKSFEITNKPLSLSLDRLILISSEENLIQAAIKLNLKYRNTG